MIFDVFAILFFSFILWMQHSIGKSIMFFTISSPEEKPFVFYLSQVVLSFAVLYFAIDQIREFLRS